MLNTLLNYIILIDSLFVLFCAYNALCSNHLIVAMSMLILCIIGSGILLVNVSYGSVDYIVSIYYIIIVSGMGMLFLWIVMTLKVGKIKSKNLYSEWWLVLFLLSFGCIPLFFQLGSYESQFDLFYLYHSLFNDSYSYREHYGTNISEFGYYLYIWEINVVYLGGVLLFFALVATVFITITNVKPKILQTKQFVYYIFLLGGEMVDTLDLGSSAFAWGFKSLPSNFFFSENIWYVLVFMGTALFTVVGILISVAFYTLAERKIMASLQRRFGPNVVGTRGVLQPLVDGLKLICKETIIPLKADTWLFVVAPIVSFVLAFSLWAFIPFSTVNLSVDSSISLLCIFAISSIAIYGIILGGWSSNSKYAFLGALRTTAQMISYEIVLGTIYLTIALLAGSLNFLDIIMAQQKIWFIFIVWPIGLIFLVAMLAETNRAPFDLPESEAEIVAGYNIEYSGLLFAFYFLAEYSNMLLFGALFALLFLGGWSFSWIVTLAIFSYIIKILGIAIFFIIIRAALPRLRYDQLMFKSWTILLPIAFSFFIIVFIFLINFFATKSINFIFLGTFLLFGSLVIGLINFYSSRFRIYWAKWFSNLNHFFLYNYTYLILFVILKGEKVPRGEAVAAAASAEERPIVMRPIGAPVRPPISAPPVQPINFRHGVIRQYLPRYPFPSHIPLGQNVPLTERHWDFRTFPEIFWPYCVQDSSLIPTPFVPPLIRQYTYRDLNEVVVPFSPLRPVHANQTAEEPFIADGRRFRDLPVETKRAYAQIRLQQREQARLERVRAQAAEQAAHHPRGARGRHAVQPEYIAVYKNRQGEVVAHLTAEQVQGRIPSEVLRRVVNQVGTGRVDRLRFVEQKPSTVPLFHSDLQEMQRSASPKLPSGRVIDVPAREIVENTSNNSVGGYIAAVGVGVLLAAAASYLFSSTPVPPVPQQAPVSAWKKNVSHKSNWHPTPARPPSKANPTSYNERLRDDAWIQHKNVPPDNLLNSGFLELETLHPISSFERTLERVRHYTNFLKSVWNDYISLDLGFGQNSGMLLRMLAMFGLIAVAVFIFVSPLWVFQNLRLNWKKKNPNSSKKNPYIFVKLEDEPDIDEMEKKFERLARERRQNFIKKILPNVTLYTLFLTIEQKMKTMSYHYLYCNLTRFLGIYGIMILMCGTYCYLYPSPFFFTEMLQFPYRISAETYTWNRLQYDFAPEFLRSEKNLTRHEFEWHTFWDETMIALPVNADIYLNFPAYYQKKIPDWFWVDIQDLRRRRRLHGQDCLSAEHKQLMQMLKHGFFDQSDRGWRTSRTKYKWGRKTWLRPWYRYRTPGPKWYTRSIKLDQFSWAQVSNYRTWLKQVELRNFSITHGNDEFGIMRNFYDTSTSRNFAKRFILRYQNLFDVDWLIVTVQTDLSTVWLNGRGNWILTIVIWYGIGSSCGYWFYIMDEIIENDIDKIKADLSITRKQRLFSDSDRWAYYTCIVDAALKAHLRANTELKWQLSDEASDEAVEFLLKITEQAHKDSLEHLSLWGYYHSQHDAFDAAYEIGRKPGFKAFIAQRIIDAEADYDSNVAKYNENVWKPYLKTLNDKKLQMNWVIWYYLRIRAWYDCTKEYPFPVWEDKWKMLWNLKKEDYSFNNPSAVRIM